MSRPVPFSLGDYNSSLKHKDVKKMWGRETGHGWAMVPCCRLTINHAPRTEPVADKVDFSLSCRARGISAPEPTRTKGNEYTSRPSSSNYGSTMPHSTVRSGGEV